MNEKKVQANGKLSFKTNSRLSEAISTGNHAILCLGNTNDNRVIGGQFVYLPDFLNQELHEAGFIVLQLSKGRGFRVFRWSSYPPKKQNRIRALFNKVGINKVLNKQLSAEELNTVLGALGRLLQLPGQSELRFACNIQYGEHLAPAGSGGMYADQHIVCAEVLHQLAHSTALKKAGNLVISFAKNGGYHPLLNDLYKIEFDYPDHDETRAFINYALNGASDVSRNSSYARLESNFDRDHFERLVRGLPIHHVERMMRTATGILTRESVLRQRDKAIVSSSDGTLSVYTGSLTSWDEYIGNENLIAHLKTLTEEFAAGSRSVPLVIIFAGPPGTGKTALPYLIARHAGWNIVTLESPKSGILGETEQRVRRQFGVLEAMCPVVGFRDEITESVPKRSDYAGDGGVSQDILAQYFQFTARTDLLGKFSLMGCTNVPHKLDNAWLDRACIYPVLELDPRSLARLVPLYEKRISGQITLKPEHPLIIESMKVLHLKGCSPRSLYQDVVIQAYRYRTKKQIQPEDIAAAAEDYRGTGNMAGVIYASLCAINLCSFKSLLPWYKNKDYILPYYLEEIVDVASGEVDHAKLQEALHRYEKEANL